MGETTTGELKQFGFILLVRHGHRAKVHEEGRSSASLLNRDERPLPDLISVDKAKLGGPLVAALATWVAETLSASELVVSDVVCSRAQDAQDTAGIYCEILLKQQLCTVQKPVVDDGLIEKPGMDQVFTYQSLLQPLSGMQIAEANGSENESRVLLICGHQPQLSQIANAWLGGWLWRRRSPIPLREGEAALVQITRPRRVRWAVTKLDTGALQLLRDKIKSKIQLAEVFAGATSISTAILFQTSQPSLDWGHAYYWLGIGLLLCALLLTLLALITYDRLAMPKMFWSAQTRGRQEGMRDRLNRMLPGWELTRPPTREHLVLYSALIRSWYALFLPAFYCFFLGLAALAIHLTQEVLIAALGTGLAFFLLFIWSLLVRPNLGPQD